MSSAPLPIASRTDLWRGVYDARRAAALAGVRRRTLTRWAAEGVYCPSISPEPRTRLWSWFDLIALRTIDWLRKPQHDGALKPVPMAAIRRALTELEGRGLSRADLHNLAVRSRYGELFFETGPDLVRVDPSRQLAMPGLLPVVRPYQHAPDLLEPRPLLRIIPGKLNGEPHVRDTRIGSATLYELDRQGFSARQIAEMYPDADLAAIAQAIELEQSLHRAA